MRASVLVNNSGHFNVLIAHAESATNHHWMSEVDPGCNISYRQPPRASYGCGVKTGSWRLVGDMYVVLTIAADGSVSVDAHGRPHAGPAYENGYGLASVDLVIDSLKVRLISFGIV
jgi:hypothetical protein